MSHWGLSGRVLGAGAIWALCAIPAASADALPVVRPRDPRLIVERLVRRWDWREGLPGSYLSNVLQDREGFIWVAGPEGVSRYDGTGFKTFSPQGAALISGGAGSRGVIFGYDHMLREIRDGTAIDLHCPRSDLDEADWGAAVGSDGGVWWTLGNRIWRLDEAGRWSELTSPAPPDEPVRGVRAGWGADVIVWNRDELWSLAPDGATRELAKIHGAFDVRPRPDGSLLVGANQSPGPVTTRVFEIRGGTTKLLFERIGSKFGGMVERGSRLWVSTDAGLFGIGEGAPPLFVATSEMFYAAGSICVDREGSLWSATFRGLIQLPEPETFAAAFQKVARNLVHSGKRTWLSSWGEMARFDDGAKGFEAHSFGPNFGVVCQDGVGRAWAQAAGGFGRIGETSFEYGPGADVHGGVASCSLAPSGTMWVSVFPSRLLVVRRGEDTIIDVQATFPPGMDGFERVREDGRGKLWGYNGDRVCSTDVEAVLHRRPTAWTCENVGSVNGINDIAFMPSGDVWLAAGNGILSRRHGRWELLPASLRLHSRWTHAIRPSPSGGAWIVAMGAMTRVIERPESPDGFEIVEDLSAWQGVPTLSGSDVAEDADGTLWFATDAGLMKVPSEVRRARREQPPVVLIEATADARPLTASRSIELPYRRNRLELRFAALSFRDPMAIRYRSRVRAGDPWSNPSKSPTFRFVDLAPGRYRVEVEASLDGERWSETPAVFAFRVLKPWYLQAWFFITAALAIGAALSVVYRLRVRALLRLERQRTRIAMDLHDEVGSGLGTISVLAGIVAREGLEPSRRDEFAARIGTVSRELSQALGDIVWSLRPGSGTLDAAWNQILDRARPLFASGSPRLEVDAPKSVPALPLSVVARRSLFLVAIEALHNAARHSGATRVELALVRTGADWALSVTDDGRGIAPSPPAGGRRGLGLEGMRARAGDMGASITWEPAPDGGTRVILKFRPDSD